MKSFRTIITTASITLLLATIGFAFFYFNLSTENKINANITQNETSTEPVDTFIKPANFDNRLNLNNQISNNRRNIITSTVELVSPAVVGINVTEIRQYRSPWANDPFFRRFFGDRVYNQPVKSLGSGVIISPDGYIITNDHVAGNGTEIIVTMTDGSRHNAKIIGTDEVTDICLLKIDSENLPFINFALDNDLLIGEWAIALGNPFGLFEINDKPTVTVGVISAVGMNLGNVENRYYLDMIQTDASINGGNSGGPLVNSLGELIGLNTIIYSPNAGSGSVGVGFAIPVWKLKKIVSELKEKGSIERNFWTGIYYQDIDTQIANALRLDKKGGVIVSGIVENSPAERAGIKEGDIICKVGKYPINNSKVMIGAFHDFRDGDTVDIGIIRDNNVITKNMKLERK